MLEYNKMNKYPLHPHIFYPSKTNYKNISKIQQTKMPKIHPKDKLLYAVDAARRALIQGRPILEEFTDDKDPAEVIQKNLEYSYKQRYNNHLAQLHYIGQLIHHYKTKDYNNTQIRQVLGVTRQQYYNALAIHKAIKEPDAIPYLEEISIKDFRLSEKELDYIRYGAWPDHIDPAKEAQKEKEREDQIRKLVKELVGEPSSQ